MRIHMHVGADARTVTHTRARAHAHTHVHICTHTHTLFFTIYLVHAAAGHMTFHKLKEGTKQQEHSLQAISCMQCAPDHQCNCNGHGTAAWMLYILTCRGHNVLTSIRSAAAAACAYGMLYIITALQSSLMHAVRLAKSLQSAKVHARLVCMYMYMCQVICNSCNTGTSFAWYVHACNSL